MAAIHLLLSTAILAIVLSAVVAFDDVNSQNTFGQSSGLGNKYQTWTDWMKKRQFGESAHLGMGGWPQLDNQQFSRWNDFYPLNIRKRQLSSNSGFFGTDSRYFANGLQDWRNTFNGSKK